MLDTDTLVVEALVAVRAEMNPLVKVSPVPERLVVEALVEKRRVIVPTVVDELLKYACPVVVKLVAEALARVVWPVTVSVEMVVVARVEVPVTTKESVTVALVAVRLVGAKFVV